MAKDKNKNNIIEEEEQDEKLSPDIDYSDETQVPELKTTEADKKRLKKFQDRERRMNAYGEHFRRKFDKNYKYFRGYQPNRFGEKERWRSDVFVPTIFPRVQAYEARMNDRLPEPICRPRTPNATDKAQKKQMALEYILDVSNAKQSFDNAKSQGLKYGKGIVGVFWDDSSKKVKKIVDVDKEGNPKIEVTEEPLYKEQIRVVHIDVYDFYVDPAASCIADAEDCYYRIMMPTKEARRKYWNIGLKRGKYIKSGMGRIHDSRDMRFDVSKSLAEKNFQQPPIILDDGSLKSSNFGHGGVADTEEMVEIKYYYNKIEDIYQVWCGEICLIDGPNPYEHKELPFADWDDIKIEGEFYGLGECDILEPFQDMLNEIRNSRLDQVRLSTFKTIFLGPGAGIKEEDMGVGPLKVIPLRDANQVRFLDVPPVGSEIYQEEDLVRQDAEITSGMSDVNNAAEQRVTDTATGLNIQVQSMEERLNQKMRNFENGMFKRTLFLLSELMAQFWDEDRILAVTGDDGLTEEVITNEDLTSEVEIDCKPGSGLPPNKLAMREQFLQFFNLVAPLPNVVNDELVRMLGDMFDVKNIDDILISIRQFREMKHAEEENDTMLRGSKAAVKEVYVQDHELHLQKHQDIVESPDFVSVDPAVQAIFLEHIQEHIDSIPAAPDIPPNVSPDGNPASPLVDNSAQSVPPPSNVTPVNPTVLPGADAFGGQPL